MERTAQHRCFGGSLSYWQHESASTGTPMRFTVFLPPQAEKRECPAVIFLSGLTCTEDNFTTKAGAYRTAAELGLIIVAPDTSPRGEEVPDAEGYDLGKGAGFYVDATEAPWSRHYTMYSYLTKELHALLVSDFPIDPARIGIMGHSMGGHGALVLGLRHPERYRSLSAFAPIVAPMEVPWGQKAFTAYLGTDRSRWEGYDACHLMRKQNGAASRPPILIDQGLGDAFLAEQLKPELFEAACKEVGQTLRLRRHDGYDHGYFFIQSFVDDHLRHHAAILNGLSL